MRIVIQRVKEAAVKVDDKLEGTIGKGLLVFLGIENDDDLTDVIWLVNKLSNIRIFNDTEGIMNKSLIQVKKLNKINWYSSTIWPFLAFAAVLSLCQASLLQSIGFYITD